MTSDDFREELKRIRRVSDLLCTTHAGLKSVYARRALIAELTTLLTSTWLIALVFVEPRINIRLTPLGLDPEIWIGLLSVATFFLTILQIKTDWKGVADAHGRSLSVYSEVKRECGYLLASDRVVVQSECDRLLARYEMATEVGTCVPEAVFLKYKKRHLMKVAISKRLDSHPGTSIIWFKFRVWLRDNFEGRAQSRKGSGRDTVGDAPSIT